MPSLGQRARNLLDDIDDGCTPGEIRDNVEALLGQLEQLGVDRDVAVIGQLPPAQHVVVTTVEPDDAWVHGEVHVYPAAR